MAEEGEVRAGWLVVAVVIGCAGVVNVAGGLWSLVVDREWMVLLALPVSALLHDWLAAGAWRRAHRDVRGGLAPGTGPPAA